MRLTHQKKIRTKKLVTLKDVTSYDGSKSMYFALENPLEATEPFITLWFARIFKVRCSFIHIPHICVVQKPKIFSVFITSIDRANLKTTLSTLPIKCERKYVYTFFQTSSKPSCLITCKIHHSWSFRMLPMYSEIGHKTEEANPGQSRLMCNAFYGGTRAFSCSSAREL